MPAGVRHSVRQALPGARVFQVVHVDGPGAVARAREAAEGTDHLLLDVGAAVMYGSGEVFSAAGTAFSLQLVEPYAQTLGA